jgi:hypothetical protein
MLAPALIPLAEKSLGTFGDFVGRGVGWLADKVFGDNKKSAPMPDYSR